MERKVLTWIWGVLWWTLRATERDWFPATSFGVFSKRQRCGGTAPFECRWSTRNCWDENRWFAFRVPPNRIADRMLDYIATVHCSKSYSSGKSQWNFQSFESRFGVWCKSNSALSCMCRKSYDQRSREYCSRQWLWLTWQFETTEWYNPECMCTSSSIQHWFANTS